MSSHGQNQLGECVSYVVSRSGKVLDSAGRVLQEIVPANVPDLTHARPLASFEGQPESFFNLAALVLTPGEMLSPNGTKKRKFRQCSKPASGGQNQKQRTCFWDDEIGCLDEVARTILKRTKKVRRKTAHKKQKSDSENAHRRLVHHLRVGISQMFILQRWESGSRELPAKWASWLLKMLRRTKPPPLALQRFLFTVLVALLPVICCNLVCQTLSILPDSEVLRSVDILCLAIEKSWSSFSPFQWEILQERIYQCQQVRLKAGTWLERRGESRSRFPLIDSDVASDTKHRHRRVDYQSLSSSSDEYGVTNDEQMSYELVRTEGVKALVRRALRERQILPSFKKGQVPCSDSSQDAGIPVSTLCPLSGMPLKVPARGVACTHLTCFDLESYLEANAKPVADKRPQAQLRWRCPYCGSDASWSQIIVDGFILRILKSLPVHVPEVLIWPDGRWGVKEPSAEQALKFSLGGGSRRDSDEEPNSSFGEEGDGSPSKQASSSDDFASPSLDTAGVQERNVKPRLAVHIQQQQDQQHNSDESQKERLRELPGNGVQDGDLSGNEASAARPDHPAISAVDPCEPVVQQPQKAKATVDLDGPNSNVPVLHEISLHNLIQSTLSKQKSNRNMKPGPVHNEQYQQEQL